MGLNVVKRDLDHLWSVSTDHVILAKRRLKPLVFLREGLFQSLSLQIDMDRGDDVDSWKLGILSLTLSSWQTLEL